MPEPKHSVTSNCASTPESALVPRMTERHAQLQTTTTSGLQDETDTLTRSCHGLVDGRQKKGGHGEANWGSDQDVSDPAARGLS